MLERFPLADDVLMSEDQEWSRRVLLAGLRDRLRAGGRVRHSHVYTLAAAFRRFFDSGASADRAYVSEARESRAALRRTGARYALGEVGMAMRARASSAGCPTRWSTSRRSSPASSSDCAMSGSRSG